MIDSDPHSLFVQKMLFLIPHYWMELELELKYSDSFLPSGRNTWSTPLAAYNSIQGDPMDDPS